MGPDHKKYSSQYWSEMDVKAQAALNDSKQPLQQRLTALIEAKWIGKALAVARTVTQKNPRNAEAWKALGALSFELGKIKAADTAIRRARKLDPNLRLPAALR